jgi:hypothetical protein
MYCMWSRNVCSLVCWPRGRAFAPGSQTVIYEHAQSIDVSIAKSPTPRHDTGFEMLVLDGEMRRGVLNRGHSGSGMSWE